MRNDRLLPEDDLKSAFRAVRDAYDGENEEANLTLQRALFRTRAGERRRRLTRWVVLPFAAVLVASTAWAAATGKLTPVVTSVVEAFYPEPLPREEARAAAPTVAAVPVAPAVPTPASAPEPALEPAPPVVVATAPPPPPAQPVVAISSAPAAPAQPGAVVPPPVSEPATAPSTPAPEPSAPAPSPAASAPDPHDELFAEAHRLHFIDRDPARALAAWDRCLAAAPNGRLAPEARYNRAITLIRLGRHTEAKKELTPFASGVYGSYRRDEARALLDALAREAGAP